MWSHAARVTVPAEQCRQRAIYVAPRILKHFRHEQRVEIRLSSNAFISRNGKESQSSSSFEVTVHQEPSLTNDHPSNPLPRPQPTGTKEPPGIAVKDNIVTLDLPTTCASDLLRDYRSPFEATVVTQFKELPGVKSKVYGKTNLDEFGMGSHSTNSAFGSVMNTLNNEQHSAGGSSGGSAVAVARNTTMFAFGTDTGGSVRLPASYTGIAGFKPSYGLISRYGVVPYANSLDTVGLLSKSVRKLKFEFLRASIHDPKDPSALRLQIQSQPITEPPKDKKISLEISTSKTKVDDGSQEPVSKKIVLEEIGSNITIGFPIEYNIAELSPEVRKAWQKTLEYLLIHGCNVVPVSLPNTRHALSAYYVIAPAEAASNLAKFDGVRYGTRGQRSDGAGDVLYSEVRGGFGKEVKRRILLGSYTLSSEAVDNYFIKAQKVRRLVQHDFDRVFKKDNPLRDPQHFDLSDMDDSVQLKDKLGPAQVDFIVCPTTPTTAPKISDLESQTPLDIYMNDVFTVPASLAGLPAISIPFRDGNYSPKYKPIGIQIIGQHLDDIRLLDLANDLSTLFTYKASQITALVNKKIRKNSKFSIRRIAGVVVRRQPFGQPSTDDGLIPLERARRKFVKKQETTPPVDSFSVNRYMGISRDKRVRYPTSAPSDSDSYQRNGDGMMRRHAITRNFDSRKSARSGYMSSEEAK